MKKNLSYIDSVHRDGTIWNLSVMVLLMAFPVAVAILFQVMPDWAALGAGLIATAGLTVVISNLFFTDLFAQGFSLAVFNWKAILLAAVLIVFTNFVKKTKKLHPIVFIGVSAVAGILFSMG